MSAGGGGTYYNFGSAPGSGGYQGAAGQPFVGQPGAPVTPNVGPSAAAYQAASGGFLTAAPAATYSSIYANAAQQPHPTGPISFQQSTNPVAGFASPNSFGAPAGAAVAPNPYVTADRMFGGGLQTQSQVSSSTPIGNIGSISGASTAVSATPSGLSNYDAALYAAASSYLQSHPRNPPSVSLTDATSGFGKVIVQQPQHQIKPQANNIGDDQCMGLLKRGTGRASFNRRGRGGGGRGGIGRFFGGRSQTVHFCDVCKISCASEQTYKEHLEGQRHKKKETQAKSGEGLMPMARNKVTYRCDLCQVSCTGKDTYDAHVQGVKHQKAVKLHQALGKPVPNSTPTLLPPSNMLIGGSGAYSESMRSGFSDTGSIRSSSQKSNLTELKSDPEMAAAVEAALAVEKDVEPVGEDYIEEGMDGSGKSVQFYCKLCECKFHDPHAKMMHLKGRRHRLMFKKKVNPDLEVEPERPYYSKFGYRRWIRGGGNNRLAPYAFNMQRPYFTPGVSPFIRPPSLSNSNANEMDDRHMLEKHSEIQPADEQMEAIQKFVSDIEKALKGISDKFHNDIMGTNEGAKSKEQQADANKGNEASDTTAEPERVLKGVMRVGLLAKGLLLRDDREVKLVVISSEKPTRTLLKRIHDLLPEYLTKVSEERYNVAMSEYEGLLKVTTASEPRYSTNLALTSIAMRDEDEEGNVASPTSKVPDPIDVLDKQKCLDALAELRRAKWFQARCVPMQCCPIVLRVMIDVCRRIPTWSPLPVWALELLIEKVMSSAGVYLTAGAGLRRLFEALASGLILPAAPGILDPCERQPVDVLAALNPQQREDITSSAQHALRLIAFNQLYKILAINRLPDRVVRKRPLDQPELQTEEENGKKDKKDEIEA